MSARKSRGGGSKGVCELVGNWTFKAIITDTMNIREMQNKNFRVMVKRRVKKRFMAGEENEFVRSLNAEG